MSAKLNNLSFIFLDLSSPTRKTPRGFCATHLPVRKIVRSPLPSEGATSPPSDSLHQQGGGGIAFFS